MTTKKKAAAVDVTPLEPELFPAKLITKQQAAAIAGTHPKTLEKWIKKPEFCEATGYTKNGMNTRVMFDEQKFRAYVASVTGEPIETQPEAIEAPILAIQKVKKDLPAVIQQPGPLAGLEMAAAIAKGFGYPGKIYLTLKEAQDLTSLPLSGLRTISEIKFGRRVIKRSKLEKL